MFKRLLFHIYVYFMGFRFYLTEFNVDRNKYYTSVSVSTHTGEPFIFKFYRTLYNYNVFRFGRIRTFSRYRYGVSLEFDDANHPELMKKYSYKIMNFYLPHPFLLSEQSISKYLLDIYIDYIVKQIAEEDAKKKQELPA